MKLILTVLNDFKTAVNGTFISIVALLTIVIIILVFRRDQGSFL